MTDHANLASVTAGSGKNFEMFGNRFYDISSMHNKDIRASFKHILTENGCSVIEGQTVWVNNSSIPQVSHRIYAQGLRNEKINLEAVVRKGIHEIFAI